MFTELSSKPSLMASTLSRVLESRTYRVLLATIGGYVFAAGCFAFASVTLALLGVTRAEAMWWTVITSFLVYTLVTIWVAATRRPGRTTLIIAATSIAMIVASPRLADLLGEPI